MKPFRKLNIFRSKPKEDKENDRDRESINSNKRVTFEADSFVNPKRLAKRAGSQDDLRCATSAYHVTTAPRLRKPVASCPGGPGFPAGSSSEDDDAMYNRPPVFREPRERNYHMPPSYHDKYLQYKDKCRHLVDENKALKKELSAAKKKEADLTAALLSQINDRASENERHQMELAQIMQNVQQGYGYHYSQMMPNFRKPYSRAPLQPVNYSVGAGEQMASKSHLFGSSLGSNNPMQSFQCQSDVDETKNFRLPPDSDTMDDSGRAQEISSFSASSLGRSNSLPKFPSSKLNGI